LRCLCSNWSLGSNCNSCVLYSVEINGEY